MDQELHKPDEVDGLESVISRMCEVKPGSDKFIEQLYVSSIDVDVIKRYIEDYLSDPEYSTKESPETIRASGPNLDFTFRALDILADTDTSISDVKQEEALKLTLAKISEPILRYFSDLKSVSGSFDYDAHIANKADQTTVSRAINRMQDDAEKGFFSRELLPYMLADMPQDQREADKDSSFFEAAFKNAKSNDAFTQSDWEVTCPFSRRLERLWLFNLSEIVRQAQ